MVPLLGNEKGVRDRKGYLKTAGEGKELHEICPQLGASFIRNTSVSSIGLERDDISVRAVAEDVGTDCFFRADTDSTGCKRNHFNGTTSQR